MSANQGQVYVPRKERNYAVSMVLDLDFLGIIEIKKLQETMLRVQGLRGTWGEGRKDWKWEPNPKSWCFKPLWRDENGNPTGRDIMQITIRTGCTVRYNQIHAFQNFMQDFVRLLAAEFSGMQIQAELVLVSAEPFRVGGPPRD